MTKGILLKEFENFKDVEFKREFNYLKIEDKKRKGNCVAFICVLYPALKKFVYKYEFVYEVFESENLEFIEIEKPEDFCISFMKDTSNNFMHAGIYYNDNIFHMSSKGICVNHKNVMNRFYKEIKYYKIYNKKNGEKIV